MSILDRFLKAITDGEPDAETTNTKIRHQYFGNPSETDAREQAMEMVTDWAERQDTRGGK